MSRLQQDYKNFLEPAFVSKLNSLELKARLVVEGFMVGLHKSPYHGFSVEFAQHRPYMQGDNLKDVDWKVYGKTEKFFIKQYEEETNLQSFILLDISNSMKFNSAGNISKIEYAFTLAAALSYLMIHQQDAAGLSLYAENIVKYLPPKANRTYLREILKTLAGAKASQKTNTANCLNEIAEKISRRGLVIIISEVIVFQVLDPLERSFAFGKDAIFKDLETEDEITTQPYHVQKAYKDAMIEFTSKIKAECLNSNIDYNLIETSDPFDKALLNYIQKREKLY
jgi:uncharacterized protein (DUF58 family)